MAHNNQRVENFLSDHTERGLEPLEVPQPLSLTCPERSNRFQGGLWRVERAHQKQKRKAVAAAVREMIAKKVSGVSDVYLNDLRSGKGLTQRGEWKTHAQRVVDGMLTLRASSYSRPVLLAFPL